MQSQGARVAGAGAAAVDVVGVVRQRHLLHEATLAANAGDATVADPREARCVPNHAVGDGLPEARISRVGEDPRWRNDLLETLVASPKMAAWTLARQR